jgi:hypothetical protein
MVRWTALFGSYLEAQSLNHHGVKMVSAKIAKERADVISYTLLIT